MRFFGSGALIGTPSGANPTPLQFGTLQECSLDFSFTIKELYGSYQFPDDIGRGTSKINGKAKFGQLDAAIFGALFFDEALVTGQLLASLQEAGTVPGVSTYTITVTNSATFVEDEGVMYAATQTRLNRVASAPSAGEYAVTAGVYTFAAGDASTAMLLSYTYTAATAGKKFVITNNILGDAPTFKMLFNGKRVTAGTSRQVTIQLNRCISSKLSLASKLEDFMIPDFDFNAMADDSGTVGTMSYTN